MLPGCTGSPPCSAAAARRKSPGGQGRCPRCPRAPPGGGSGGGGPGPLPAALARAGAAAERVPGAVPAAPGRTLRNYLLPWRALCRSAGLPGGSGSRLPLWPLHRRAGCHLEGKMSRRRSRDGVAQRDGGGPRAAAMRARRGPAPGQAAAELSRFGAPWGVTPSTRQTHPARCPSRRARSQDRKASPDPPEPGPYPRAGKRCPH